MINLAKRFSLVDDNDLQKLEDEWLDYQLRPSTDLPTYTPGDTRIDSFWGDMSRSKAGTGQPRFGTLCAVVLPLLSLPNSNADSERVFSMAKKIDTDSRSDLGQDTICALLSCKINTEDTCFQFQPSAELLKAAKSATWDYVKSHPSHE